MLLKKPVKWINSILGWHLDAFDLSESPFLGKKMHPRLPIGHTELHINKFPRPVFQVEICDLFSPVKVTWLTSDKEQIWNFWQERHPRTVVNANYEQASWHYFFYSLKQQIILHSLQILNTLSAM